MLHDKFYKPHKIHTETKMKLFPSFLCTTMYNVGRVTYLVTYLVTTIARANRNVIDTCTQIAINTCTKTAGEAPR